MKLCQTQEGKEDKVPPSTTREQQYLFIYSSPPFRNRQAAGTFGLKNKKEEEERVWVGRHARAAR